MLPSGKRLEVLEIRDEWTRVQLEEFRGELKEGWVLSRYLIERPPWEAQAKRLLEENSSLREKLAMIEKNWEESSRQAQELQTKLQESAESLRQVQSDFDSLKSESADFLSLKERYETTRSALDKAEEAVSKLSKENEILKSSQRVEWILAGALIFLGAWVIGLIVGRREKKRRRGVSGFSR
jgi:SH3 domain protein